jgi:beta-glucosidase
MICQQLFHKLAGLAGRKFGAGWRTLLLACILLASLPLAAQNAADSNVKANALLAKMSLDEKIGQMVQTDSGVLKSPADVQKYFIGSVFSGADSNPADNRPEALRKLVNGFQAQALRTPLKIPLLYGVDAVHGHNKILGSVIFPHHVGLGAAHDPQLVLRAEHATAEELAGTGIRWAFAPCIAVSRDIRWGRSYESYGQSADLVSELGVAAIRGFQGDQLDSQSVLACAKHFAGDGGTENGRNEGDTVCDEATFRQLYLAPYQAAVQAGVGSIMVSFSSWNGQKMHSNKHLLTDVLKNELGFQGFLVSDWAAIDRLAPDYKQDIATAINAGLDMAMIPYGPGETNSYVDFIRDLKELTAEGKVPVWRIDDAARRILRVKYQMGLFDHPYTDPALLATVGSPAHREIARACVRESLVLLKNSGRTLPLKKDLKHLAVVGQAADDIGLQCGGWTLGWQGKAGNVTTGGTTLLAAIRKTVSPDTEVTYSSDGANLKSPDAVVVAIAEEPYAETRGDRQDLNLPATDLVLIARAKAAGVPVVTLLYSGRPLLLGAGFDQSDAFVAAWLPGTEGLGLTDILFGDYTPTGKLPRLWPSSDDQFAVGQVTGKPLFPAGFGLSYEFLSQK